MSIKVMIVDDSAFVRQSLKKLIDGIEGIEVIITARNGEDALYKVDKYEIDVITMDVEMPEMNGLEATKEIMKKKSTPIIMLSSMTSEGADVTIKALEYGAVDFILKPTANINVDLNEVRKEIISKIKIASRVNFSNRFEKKSKSNVSSTVFNIKNFIPKILVIGTSTGGPQALQKVIPNLPLLGVPIIIIQHMPKGFTKSLASSLDLKSVLTVKEAEFGEKLEKDIVYVAPGGVGHTIIKKQGVNRVLENKTTDIVKRYYTPSVDVLLNSLRDVYYDGIVVAILTGMGNDGEEGVVNIQKTKPYIITESEESAIVYGMPRMVEETGFSNRVVHLDQIANTIKSIFKRY